VAALGLERAARPGDLVIVTPWYLGISFDRYYRGDARWTTLPPLADHAFARYDLLMRRMASESPIDAALGRVEETLLAGGSVWVVRSLPVLPRGRPPLALPPAPGGPGGWRSMPYNWAWTQQLDALLHARAATRARLRLEGEAAVSPFERVFVEVAGPGPAR
jgi:hypothetical protein